MFGGWIDGIGTNHKVEGSKEAERAEMIEWAGFLRWGSEEKEKTGKRGRGTETLAKAIEMAVVAKSWHLKFRRVSGGRGYKFESDSREDDADNRDEDVGQDSDWSRRDKSDPGITRPTSQSLQQQEQEQTVLRAKQKLSGMR